MAKSSVRKVIKHMLHEDGVTAADSTGVLHLPLLGSAAWKGKTNISSNMPVVSDDPDARACHESYPD